MVKPFEKWTVLPHGKLTEVDDGLLTVVGDLNIPPAGPFPRRMTVARLSDGRLVVYSAIALHEDEMAQLERYGAPAFLVVPNAIHRMDVKIWKQRYPTMTVIAPAGASDKVEEIVHVDATTMDLGDPSVRVVTVPGTSEGEAALVVRRATGTTVVVNDVIWNLDHRPGLRGWLLRIAGFTGKIPKVPMLVGKKAIKERRAFCEQLERWAGIEDLRRIIVSHGAIIDRDAPVVLRDLAGRLAA